MNVLALSSSSTHGALEAVATANRCHIQMKRRMARMTAFIYECLGRLLVRPNLDELLISAV
jgi:hypothetical protein